MSVYNEPLQKIINSLSIVANENYIEKVCLRVKGIKVLQKQMSAGILGLNM